MFVLHERAESDIGNSRCWLFMVMFVIGPIFICNVGSYSCFFLFVPSLYVMLVATNVGYPWKMFITLTSYCGRRCWLF